MESKRAIVNDVITLHKQCGVTDVAFMLPIHPEKQPLTAKVNHLRTCFSEMKEELKDSGLKIGILVQSLISHGSRGRAITDADLEKIITSDGKCEHRFCPLGEKFQEYSRWAINALAATEPDFFLIDDDFRLFLGGFGCFCELHLSAFASMSGQKYSLGQLVEILQKDDEESRRIGLLWNDLHRSSLIALSKVVRAGIDAADPGIPCGYCTSSEGEFVFAASIAKVLAGKTKPFVRVNNSHYHEDGYKIFPRRMYNTALQAAYLHDIPEILTEADTFPQHRYSMSALALHGQISGSLLNGATGVKLWITRLAEYEPECGVAYRGMLKRYRGFYEELSRILPKVEWHGPSTPFPSLPAPLWNPIESGKQVYTTNWVGNILGRMGIPCQFGGKSEVTMLAGREVDFFSDKELLGFLGSGLLLDGAAAEKFCKRGFSEYLGIEVEDIRMRVSLEKLRNNSDLNGEAAGAKMPLLNLSFTTRKIILKNEKVKILSDLMLESWYECPDSELKLMGPGLTLFENKLGGRVAVYATSLCGDTWNDLMNFVTLKRKQQLIRLVELLGNCPFPFVVLSDVDLYVKHGHISTESGKVQLLCVFNLNPDSLPKLHLRVENPNISEIRLLSESGEWQNTSWKSDGNSELMVNIPVEMMKPLIFRIH